MSTYLWQLARWCFRRRCTTVAAWLVVLAAAGVVTAASGGKTSDAVTILGTEVQRAVTVLQAKLPATSGASTQVVFTTVRADFTSGTYRPTIEASVRKLAVLHGQVVAATDPYQTTAISPDQHLALATVSYDGAAAEVTTSTLVAAADGGDRCQSRGGAGRVRRGLLS